MSRSTLPDIFKEDLLAIKFHPEDRPRKIGGRFAIKPIKHVHPEELSQRNSTLIVNKLQTTTGFTKSIYDGVQSKCRSQSIGNIQPAIKYDSMGRNSVVKAKKSVGFAINDEMISNSIITRKHSQSMYKKDTPTLEQIYYQNVVKQKSSLSGHQRQGTNFVYETSRLMNNMQIELQQADSFKNRVKAMLQEERLCERALSDIRKQTSIVRYQMEYFHQAIISDIDEFQGQFLYRCKQLMRNLSQARRETGEETKENVFDIDRVADQYADAQAIFEVIDQRVNFLRGECLDDRKLELTNRKTYTQDVSLRLQRSVRESHLDKLMRRTKRSGTSQSIRNNMNSLPLQTQLHPRAQTSSGQRKPLYHLQLNKQPQHLLEIDDNSPSQNQNELYQKDSLDLQTQIKNANHISPLKLEQEFPYD